VLAAIQSGAIGGGVDLVAACDMRYATEDAFLTIFETNIALTADVGTFPRLCKLLPEGIVRELAYTGCRISAREVFERGLVNRLLSDHASMLAGVLEVAAEIASKAPPPASDKSWHGKEAQARSAEPGRSAAFSFPTSPSTSDFSPQFWR